MGEKKLSNNYVLGEDETILTNDCRYLWNQKE